MLQHIILAPDSFKGTLTAAEICAIQQEVIARHLPHARITQLPMADGGEGMTEAYLRICGGEKVALTVPGPLGDPAEGFYGLLPDGSAVIEMAAAAGLPLVEGKNRLPEASTYGVGVLIRHAAEHGASRILLGLGGSATNDCGIGMAAALGYRFYDDAGQPVEPLARHMERIARFELEHPLPPLEVTAACDVDNPLCGPRGATAIFGPQKGGSPEELALLEQGMTHMAGVMERQTGRPIASLPGAGAAGGMGAGVLCFLQGRLCPGVELLLDTAGFDGLLEQADLVLTGEGRMDAQSVHGKVPYGIGRRCQRRGVPCIAICGALGEGAQAMYEHGIAAMFSTIHQVTDMAQIRASCRDDMRLTVDGVMRALLCMGQTV